MDGLIVFRNQTQKYSQWLNFYHYYKVLPNPPQYILLTETLTARSLNEMIVNERHLFLQILRQKGFSSEDRMLQSGVNQDLGDLILSS